MSRLIILSLSDEERAALEKGHRHGKSHAFRTRCHMILLKADRLPSAQVAERVGSCMMSVNGWVARYRAEGIDGLATKPGRGRRPIPDDRADLGRVRAAVQNHRQDISLAGAELEASLGKEFSAMTLKRFHRNTAAATSDLREKTQGPARRRCLHTQSRVPGRTRSPVRAGPDRPVLRRPERRVADAVRPVCLAVRRRAGVVACRQGRGRQLMRPALARQSVLDTDHARRDHGRLRGRAVGTLLVLSAQADDGGTPGRGVDCSCSTCRRTRHP